MYFLSHDGIQLYYELKGSGPPLLLIAGLASDSRSWLPVADGLAERFTLIMPDNRGAGRSSQECPISIDLLADDCLALVRHLGLEKVNMLGHSMGGMAAISFAVRNPRMLEKLLLAATSPRNPARNNLLFSDWADACASGSDRAAWFRSIFTWIFTERFFDDHEVVEGAVRYLLDDPWPQSPQAFRCQVDAIAACNVTAGLDRITAPTCVIAGDRDAFFSLDSSTELARQIPGARLTVIGEAAHSIHSEQPDQFVRAVSGFLLPE